jgi:hypothetical protein
MPFVSKAQRAWMHIHDPKMAKRWEKHTKKGAKLPYHVKKEEKDFYENVEDGFGEDDNQTKHLGFDVQEFNDDPIEEMPHLEADFSAAGKHFEAIDLRIEKYPIPESEKKLLFKEFSETGLVGDYKGVLLHFKPDYTVEITNPKDAQRIPRLPDGWEKSMLSVSESKIPAMSTVFRVTR